MNLEAFKSTFDRAVKERNFSYVMNIGLLLILIPLVWHVITLEPTRILVPPKLSKEASVSADKADAEFVRHMALYFSYLLGNTTPEQVDQVSTLLEPYLGPSIRNAVLVGLQEDADRLKENNITRQFVVNNSFYEDETGKAFVFGNEYVSGTAEKRDRTRKTYEFVIEIEDFRPVIADLTSYEGDPRTLKQLELMQRREQRERERNGG